MVIRGLALSVEYKDSSQSRWWPRPNIGNWCGTEETIRDGHRARSQELTASCGNLELGKLFEAEQWSGAGLTTPPPLELQTKVH